MPTKSKTFRHPSLAKLLDAGGACGEGRDEAVKFASRYPTLTAAVAACRGERGRRRLDWYAFLGARDEYDAVRGTYYESERNRLVRRIAAGVAKAMDGRVARTRKAAQTRQAMRAAARAAKPALVAAKG